MHGIDVRTNALRGTVNGVNTRMNGVDAQAIVDSTFRWKIGEAKSNLVFISFNFTVAFRHGRRLQCIFGVLGT